MLAVLGGGAAALAWATGTLCAARAARRAGALATLAWVMGIGLVLLSIPLAVSPAPRMRLSVTLWLAAGGGGDLVGLVLSYYALRLADVGLVAPIVSAEGGAAAALAIVSGEPVSPARAAALAAVLLGLALAGRGAEDTTGASARAMPRHRRAALLATAAALSFGVSLYGVGRAGAQVPLAWAVLPPRLFGALALTAPFALRGALRLTRGTAPYVVAAAACEVAGFYAYAFGARHGLAPTAVLASLGGLVAAALGRAVLGERLKRAQAAGAFMIAAGVAALAALSA